MINIETQLKKAAAAVASLEQAGVGVVEVILSRNTGTPFILLDGKDAQDLILTDKVKLQPRAYECQKMPQGFMSETYKCIYMDCVVWFAFVSAAKNTNLKNDAPILN